MKLLTMSLKCTERTKLYVYYLTHYLQSNLFVVTLKTTCLLCARAPYDYLYFSYQPKLGKGIDPGLALTQFASSILDETRFEPTIF